MEITWLKNEDNAIQYVYASAVPQKIPLDIFKEDKYGDYMVEK